MRLIATRIYEWDDGEISVDKLYRRGDSFALYCPPLTKHSGGWTLMSVDDAREWLDKAPEQLVEVREAI